MTPRRLIPTSLVDRWETELTAAGVAAVAEMHTHVLSALRSHGITMPTAMVAATKKQVAVGIGVGLSVWGASRWLSAVQTHIAPVANRVAGEAVQAAQDAVPASDTFGMPNAAPAIAAGLAAGATAAGVYIGSRLNQDIASATDPGQAAADVFDTAGDIVGGQMGAAAEGTSNAASSAVTSYLSSVMSPAVTTGATQTWNAVGDDNTRPDHMDADGQEVNLGEPFDVGGEQLLYPGDPQGSDEQTINCVPGCLPIDPVAPLAMTRRFVHTEMVVVKTRRGDVLATTPNHPALTKRGWVPLGDIEIGDHLIHADLRDRTDRTDPDVQDIPPNAEECFRTLTKDATGHRVVGSPMDFHGDGADGEVEIVPTNWRLSLVRDLPSAQRLGECILVGRGHDQRFRLDGGPGSHPSMDHVGVVALATSDGLGGAGQSGPFVRGRAAHPSGHALATVPGCDPGDQQLATDGRPGDAMESCQRLFGFAADISTDEVVMVRRFPWSGHVYNLQSAVGWFQSSGYLLQNCRCWLTQDGIDPGVGEIEGLDQDDPAAGLENIMNRIGTTSSLPTSPRSYRN